MLYLWSLPTEACAGCSTQRLSPASPTARGFREHLLAKDEKGNSKLLELVADDSCTALVKVLCAKDSTIKSAVMSVETFAAMAKPKTAAAALRLIEVHGIAIDDKMLAPLTMVKLPMHAGAF